MQHQLALHAKPGEFDNFAHRRQEVAFDWI